MENSALNDLGKIFMSAEARTLLGYTQSAIVLLDPQGNLLDWNPTFDRFKAALPSAERLIDFVAEANRQHFQVMLASRETHQAHLRFLPNLSESIFSCLLMPLPDGSSLFFAEISSHNLADELRRLKQEQEKTQRSLKLKQIELEALLLQTDEILHTDALTFLPNREKIMLDLQFETHRSDRYRKALTILVADLDNFKSINDTYGHSAADKTLRTAACEMLTSIRQIDRLGRLSGDAFLFILPSTTQKKSLLVANRVLEKLRAMQVKTTNNQTIQITISIGIAQYRIGKESAIVLLNRAEIALAGSKQNGRDRLSIASSKPV